MSHTILVRFLIGIMSLFVVAQTAFAYGGSSVSIGSVYPTGAIQPGQAVTFYVGASGFANPVYSVTDAFPGSSLPGNAIDVGGNFSWTPKVTDAGLHSITVNVTDAQGNSGHNVVTILVAAGLLVQNLQPGSVVAVGRPVTFTVNALGFNSPSFSLSDQYAGSTITSSNLSSSGVFTWTPPSNGLGLHTLSISASDTYGHTAQANQSILVIAPYLQIGAATPGLTVAAGTPFSLALPTNLATTTLQVADVFTGTSTASSGSSFSSGTFSWKPSTSDVGTHSLTFTATDPYGNAASTTQSVVVTAAVQATTSTVAPAPQIPTSSVPTQPAPSYRFTRQLRIGSRGADVTALQKKLSSLGFLGTPATGFFGSGTARAVRAFQKAHKIISTGALGPATRVLLNQ